jgi:hypothetical protein
VKEVTLKVHQQVNRQNVVTGQTLPVVYRSRRALKPRKQASTRIMGLPCRGWLLALNGSERGRDHRLYAGRNRIGASRKCPITLQGKFVSRRHFVIDLEVMPARLVDLHSTNGTYVNGERVIGVELRDGDIIEVGGLRLRYREAGLLDDPHSRTDRM